MLCVDMGGDNNFVSNPDCARVAFEDFDQCAAGIHPETWFKGILRYQLDRAQYDALWGICQIVQTVLDTALPGFLWSVYHSVVRFISSTRVCMVISLSFNVSGPVIAGCLNSTMKDHGKFLKRHGSLTDPQCLIGVLLYASILVFDRVVYLYSEDQQ